MVKSLDEIMARRLGLRPAAPQHECVRAAYISGPLTPAERDAARRWLMAQIEEGPK